MKIVIISKTTFNVIQLNNVTNIAFSSGTFTITYGSPSQTATYAAADYNISILYE